MHKLGFGHVHLVLYWDCKLSSGNGQNCQSGLTAFGKWKEVTRGAWDLAPKGTKQPLKHTDIPASNDHTASQAGSGFQARV